MSYNRPGITFHGVIIVGLALTLAACQSADLSLSDDVSITEPTEVTLPSPTIEQQEQVDLSVRDFLTYDELMSGFEYASPFDESALTMPVGAAPTEHIFEGRLELVGEDLVGDLTVLLGNPDMTLLQ